MYATCLFCHRFLGRNEAIENCPIGRRLAFDPVRGRLWVVCGHCRQWNLVPFEERWEALEDCERRSRGEFRQVSTGEITSIRLREGVDLIRIGRPLRREFAAWRYARRLTTRYRRAMVYTAWGVASTSLAFGAIHIPAVEASLGTGIVAGIMASWGAWGLKVRHDFLRHEKRVLARITDEAGKLQPIRVGHLAESRLVEGTGSEWLLRLQHGGGQTELVGSDALRMLAVVLPATNWAGGSPREVGKAVSTLEKAGGPEAYVRASIPAARQLGYAYSGVGALPDAMRLTMEIASQEETERRAVEGELEALTAMWREAEEIAQIADGLLEPPGSAAFMAQHRHQPVREPSNPADV